MKKNIVEHHTCFPTDWAAAIRAMIPLHVLLYVYLLSPSVPLRPSVACYRTPPPIAVAPDIDASGAIPPPLPHTTDPFTLLGIDPSSSGDMNAIKSAYHRKAKVYHPDASVSKETPEHIRKRVNADFSLIQAAYEELKDNGGMCKDASSSRTSAAAAKGTRRPADSGTRAAQGGPAGSSGHGESFAPQFRTSSFDEEMARELKRRPKKGRPHGGGSRSPKARARPASADTRYKTPSFGEEKIWRKEPEYPWEPPSQMRPTGKSRGFVGFDELRGFMHEDDTERYYDELHANIGGDVGIHVGANGEHYYNANYYAPYPAGEPLHPYPAAELVEPYPVPEPMERMSINALRPFELWPETLIDLVLSQGEFDSPPRTLEDKIELLRRHIDKC